MGVGLESKAAEFSCVVKRLDPVRAGCGTGIDKGTGGQIGN